LEAKACAKAHKIVESLKRALKAWEEIPLKTLRKVIDDFPKRLNACIEAQGGYFEVSLFLLVVIN
jgi:predicted translin family RNA/ssDNA-binding protein